MYRNIGKKIKGMAVAIFILETVALVIAGLCMILASNWEMPLIIAGALVIVIGPIVSWICTWLLYGFGELIDKTCDIARNTR